MGGRRRLDTGKSPRIPPGPSAVTVVRGGRLIDGPAHSVGRVDILIERGIIRSIGMPGMSVPPGAVEFDASGLLMHPGLINAHTHGHGGLAKGMGDRWTLELLLTAGPWLNGNRTAEDKYLSTLLGAAEMVLKGCTACYDLTVEFPVPSADGLEAAGRAYQDIGMRAVLAPMVSDISFYDAIPGLMDALTPALKRDVSALKAAPGARTLAAMRKALRGWKFDHDRIRPAVAPTIPHHCSDAFMIGCRNIAADFGVGLHTHVAESKVQAVTGLRTYGMSLAMHMDRLRMVGPSFTVAHGVWLDDDDMRMLGDRGASVAHNPGSNMRLGNGLADARAMLNHGVNLAIGTDGSSCSDNQNMFESMRLASMVSKVQGPDWQRWLTTEEIVQAATVGSARALGFGDRLGRIAPGYHADIVFLDAGHINWLPLNDPTHALVHIEDGTAVHSVMIGGRLVVDNHRLTTIDMAQLARSVEAARLRLERLNQDARDLYDRLEHLVGSYCPGLAHTPLHINRFGASRLN